MNTEHTGVNSNALTLAKQLFPHSERHQKRTAGWLSMLCEKSQDCELLIVHSPGGWGCAGLEDLIDWETSVVEGVKKLLDEAGVKWEMVQYLRTRKSRWDHFLHLPEQVWYGLTGKIRQAYVVAAGLEFLRDNSGDLKILLLGASQGAAFDNTVMKHVVDRNNIFSIEMGIFFVHLPRRTITDHTLVLDSNGLVPDPVVHWSFRKTFRAYSTAPFRWIKYRLDGKPQKFTYCINVPGHEYRWEYSHVQNKIKKFLGATLIKKSSIAGGYKR